MDLTWELYKIFYIIIIVAIRSLIDLRYSIALSFDLASSPDLSVASVRTSIGLVNTRNKWDWSIMLGEQRIGRWQRRHVELSMELSMVRSRERRYAEEKNPTLLLVPSCADDSHSSHDGGCNNADDGANDR